MTGLLLALGTGLAAGLHSATWGMYKDAPHEGFKWSTYVRSPILAAAIAVAIVAGTDFDPTSPAGIVLLFGVTYGLERAFLEIYKSFLRVEDQSKYTIPMQFAIRGKVVESSALRWSACALYMPHVALCNPAARPGFRDLAGYRAMFTDFLAAIRTGNDPLMTLDIAEQDVRLVRDIYRSIAPEDS